MLTPNLYDNVRDEQNRKWECSAYEAYISHGELHVKYQCNSEQADHIITEAQIELGEYPRLLTDIFNQLTKAVKEY